MYELKTERLGCLTTPTALTKVAWSAKMAGSELAEIDEPVNTEAMPLSALQLAGFWSRVDVKTEFQCWEWKGAPGGNGYGRYAGQRTHRIAHTLVNGPIPDGMLVLHSCDNKLCCNPRHLRIGTHQDNSNDALSRNRLARGVNAGNSKLTPEQVAAIRENRNSRTLKSWAEEFGVSESTISYVRSGRSWK